MLEIFPKTNWRINRIIGLLILFIQSLSTFASETPHKDIFLKKDSLDYLVVIKLNGAGKNDFVVLELARNVNLLKSELIKHELVIDSNLTQHGYFIIARRQDGSVSSNVVKDVNKLFNIYLAGENANFSVSTLLKYLAIKKNRVDLSYGFFQAGKN